LGRLLTTQRRSASTRRPGGDRNLCYLKMLQLTQDKARTLYYLVDSDQSFLVNRPTATGEAFVRRSTIFTPSTHFPHDRHPHADRQAVGDPPVSPAVMAAISSTM